MAGIDVAVLRFTKCARHALAGWKDGMRWTLVRWSKNLSRTTPGLLLPLLLRLNVAFSASVNLLLHSLTVHLLYQIITEVGQSLSGGAVHVIWSVILMKIGIGEEAHRTLSISRVTALWLRRASPTVVFAATSILRTLSCSLGER